MRGVAPQGPFPAAYERIWQVVNRIPRGRVSTYGRVARLAGLPGRARLVGRALRSLPPGSTVPWQRVLAAGGAPAMRPGAAGQRALLEREGVRFRGRRADLAHHLWSGTRPRRPVKPPSP